MRDVAPVAIVSAHQPRDKTGQSLVLSTVDPCVPAQEDGRRSIVISTLAASALCRVTTCLGTSDRPVRNDLADIRNPNVLSRLTPNGCRASLVMDAALGIHRVTRDPANSLRKSAFRPRRGFLGTTGWLAF